MVGQVQALWLPFSLRPLSSRSLLVGFEGSGSEEKRELLPPGEPRGWLWGAEGSPLWASVPPSDLSSQYLREPMARKHMKLSTSTPTPRPQKTFYFNQVLLLPVSCISSLPMHGYGLNFPQRAFSHIQVRPENNVNDEKNNLRSAMCSHFIL